MPRRVGDLPPSHPTRNRALKVSGSPASSARADAVTPASSCVKPANSTRLRKVTRSSDAACSKSMGSKKIWLILCGGSAVGHQVSGPPFAV